MSTMPHEHGRKRRREHSNGRNEEPLSALLGGVERMQDQSTAHSVLLSSLARDIQLLKSLFNVIDLLKEDVKELRETGLAYRTAPLDDPMDVANCVIRYVLATAADTMRFLVQSVKDWESENEIRKNAAQIGSALGLSTSCYPLKQRFMAHVRDIVQHQHLGNRRDLRTVVSELNLPPDVSASVIFGRLLLTIYDLPTALELCQKPMRILGTSYDVVPFLVQGTPLFCYNCYAAGHFKESCNSPTVRCRRCAGEHATNTCRSNETKCCNCAGPHPAWDLRCTNIKSVREHENSAKRRQVGPEWGSLVNNPPPSQKTGKKQQTATAASTSLPSDSSSQETPLPSPQDTPPSMSPEAPTSTLQEDSTSTPQAAPKKHRGRPPKARAADLEQSTMTPPLSSQETPPSTSPEAPTSLSQATPKKPRGRPLKAQVADHLEQSSMHAFTIK
ncbi:Ff.00g036390.m01.CDS01 [Fusarium sp. VM40]|nr:Ff.00g036390.m01.CDS01 [Fusarium sp. VM40]